MRDGCFDVGSILAKGFGCLAGLQKAENNLPWSMIQRISATKNIKIIPKV